MSPFAKRMTAGVLALGVVAVVCLDRIAVISCTVTEWGSEGRVLRYMLRGYRLERAGAFPKDLAALKEAVVREDWPKPETWNEIRNSFTLLPGIEGSFFPESRASLVAVSVAPVPDGRSYFAEAGRWTLWAVNGNDVDLVWHRESVLHRFSAWPQVEAEIRQRDRR